MVDDRKGLIVRMPSELKRQIHVDAASNETNMNAVIVGILAKHYKFEFTPTSGSRRRSPGAREPASA